MTDTVTVAGLVATQIRHTFTSEGLEITSFRLASTSRRYDRASQSWVDGETNWFTITAFRQLAANVHASIEKGHRVIATGRLRVREWQDGEKRGQDVEVVADALGPDLAWGQAQYTRTSRPAAPESRPALHAVPDAPAPDDEGAAADVEGFPAEAPEAVPVPF
ncbi:single-stranded DNA-binding protein [Protaetiibacter mangrovi]|uniref:Single-stranded DNA-binding protein n=1 Tax=Protaetiibacter mangrovi TaxID=2970926 RepID=A0ABT1ZEC1_9MICO|nr:single-stranded DNA-binding protein [Protaetiibacter mangrovi]MCS0499056.1 single-stranded DNA-binding protein [Protaetiibacter mangrovi]TPX02841.1 single-stranded DNA-binding protein [Schumannella luteola]